MSRVQKKYHVLTMVGVKPSPNDRMVKATDDINEARKLLEVNPNRYIQYTQTAIKEENIRRQANDNTKRTQSEVSKPTSVIPAASRFKTKGKGGESKKSGHTRHTS